MTDPCIDQNQSPYALQSVRAGTERGRYLLIMVSAFFLLFHFIRTFGNNFWSDDAFTANVVQHSFSEIVDIASGDSHSPFYYFIVKCFCEVLGYNDWAYQFSSFVPYLVLMILSLTLVRRWFGIEASVLMSVMLSVVPVSVNYITEVRMYEWALMFVFMLTLSAYAFCQRPNVVNAILLIVCGLASAYIHLFAMVSAGAIFLAVIAVMFIRRRMLFVIISGAAVLIAVIPLLRKALDVYSKVEGVFWIERPPYIVEWIGYSFGDVVFLIPGIVGFAIIVTVILHEFGKDKGPLARYLEPGESDRLTQIGCLSVVVLAPFLFTFLFGIIGSYILSPFFALKYGFATLAGLWLLAGVAIARFRPDVKLLKKFLIVLLVFAIPISGYNLGMEAIQCVQTEQLLDATGDLGDAYAITDMTQMRNAVLEHYYPGIEIMYVDDGTYADHISTAKENWLFIEGGLSDEEKSQFEPKGYRVDTVKSDTYLAHYKLYVYHLVPL